MICEFCGGETVTKRVQKPYWHRGKLYLVEDVEAEVCRECGERYYHATTLDELDRMLETGQLTVKGQLNVRVVSMPA